jgi:hypothetical protein
LFGDGDIYLTSPSSRRSKSERYEMGILLLSGIPLLDIVYFAKVINTFVLPHDHFNGGFAGAAFMMPSMGSNKGNIS